MLGSKMEPGRLQNRCQKLRRKKKVLKPVLELSWADLGSSWEPSWGREMGFRPGETTFREKSCFWKNKVSRDDLVPILGRFGCPRGSKMEAAEGQKMS